MFHVKHTITAAILLPLLSGCSALEAAQAIPKHTAVATESIAAPHQEIVKFLSAELTNPTELRGFYYHAAAKNPAGTAIKANHKFPAIILAHGCSGMVDDTDALKPGLAYWVQQLTQAGNAVLAVDSFNPRGHTEVCTKTDRPILESRERPRDAYGALAYLAKRTDINAEAIYLMGFSNGATGSLYAAEADTALAKSTDNKFKAVMAFYPGCTAANKRDLKFGVPTAIFIGRADDWTPAAPCEALVASNIKSNPKSAAQLFLYDDAYHAFDIPGNKVRVRMDVRQRNNPGLASGVHVGGNDAARAKAQAEVMAFLAKHQ